MCKKKQKKVICSSNLFVIVWLQHFNTQTHLGKINIHIGIDEILGF